MAILVTNGRGSDRGNMTQAIQASRVEEVGELVDLFGLAQTFEPDFFPEWRSQLPELSDAEQQALTEMKEEYRHLCEKIRFFCSNLASANAGNMKGGKGRIVLSSDGVSTLRIG